MRKLMIVLLISAMLLSIPCATAASLSDLNWASVNPKVSEVVSNGDLLTTNHKIPLLDKPKFISSILKLIFIIKKTKTPIKPPIKQPTEPQVN